MTSVLVRIKQGYFSSHLLCPSPVHCICGVGRSFLVEQILSSSYSDSSPWLHQYSSINKLVYMCMYLTHDSQGGGSID